MKVKSSKVGIFYNIAVKQSDIVLINADGVIASDGNINKTANGATNTTKYRTDYFPISNGSKLTLINGVRYTPDFIALYDSNLNFLFSGSFPKTAQKQNEYKIDSDDYDKAIAFCRFSFTSTDIPNLTIKVEDFRRVGKGVSAAPISYGAKTTTETNVDEDNASTTVDGYEISADIEQIATKGDPIFDYVDAIRKGLKTGSDCEGDIMLVPIYDMISDGNGGFKVTAQKFGATVTVTDFELKGGECARIKYKISYNGNPEFVELAAESDGTVTTQSTESETIEVEDTEPEQNEAGEE